MTARQYLLKGVSERERERERARLLNGAGLKLCGINMEMKTVSHSWP